ncbi:MAG TPA: type III-A CRISPR-associated RAMP protein Csm3 [Saprospiraceae bacterium]|nr:type III-A CRISPR-associated RAMP protein Csm3 [Saprospiraceae bacterium]
MKLIGKNKFLGTIELRTGLHIGDSKESADIGGLDSPVVRRKDNNQPYIPGSSLKGKMRCLLEQLEGATEVGNGSLILNKLFGIIEKKNKDKEIIREAELSRLIVRDCYMDNKSVEMLNNTNIDTDMPYTEIKFENTIDRLKGAAKNGGLRNIERIPAGVIFNFEIILNRYENDEPEIEKLLHKGISILNSDYLGGSGTRGYGHILMEITKKEEIKYDL